MKRSRLAGLVFATSVLTSCGRMHKEPFEKAPLARGEIQVVRLGEEPHLFIDRVRFWSDEMNEPRFFLALVPKAPATESAGSAKLSPDKSVEKPRDANEPFHPAEVFILNHGWTDRPEYLLDDLHVDKVYDGMLGRENLRPAIVVMPDVRFADFYREHSERYPFPNYLTLVGEEVAGTVSKQYGIPFERWRWSIGGFSFGGYLSLDVGRRFAGRFSTVSVVSGFADDEWSYWPAQPQPPGPSASSGRGKNSIVIPGPVPRLFLACGTDDRLYRSMLELHQKLTALGIQHEWWTAPGGHTWKTWSAVLPVMLRFTLGTAH